MSEVREHAAAQRQSPFKGLVPYSDQDAPYFFGRDRERQIIADNLQAARLTLIYGESGVGKSSVLRAGVVHHLRRQAQDALRRRIAGQAEGVAEADLDRPRFVVVEFATWQDDPMIGLPGAIETSARLVFGDLTPPAPTSTRRLDDLIQEWTVRLGADLLIILDQFEEYLLYHPSDGAEGTFAAEFARAVARPDLRANFLVAIREDSLAKLDRFKGRVNFLANYYRVRHLDRASARDAILKPVERYNAETADSEPMTVEPGLVDRVLHDVAQGQVLVGQVGRGTVATDDRPEDRIEAPYLQLVMDRLWREERSLGSTVLRLATLDELGGAQRIVRTHLDDAMAKLPPEKRDLAANVFRFLVTPGGTKIALSATDLSEFAGVPRSDAVAVLEELATSGTRILRSVVPPDGETEVRYEIYHDVLAAAILDWRTRYVEERRRFEAEERVRAESEAVRRRATRLAIAGIVGALVLVAVIGGVFVVNDQIRARDEATRAAQEAQRQADKAHRDAVVAQTQTEAGSHVEQALEPGVDPQISLQHALTAWDVMTDAGLPPNARIETALRSALSRSHLTGVVTHDDVVWSAVFNADGSRIVTASNDHTARIVATATGSTVHVLTGHTDALTGASFTPDGTQVVTTSKDGTAKVWDATTGALIETLSHDGNDVFLARSDRRDATGDYIATGAFTRDGRYLVTAAGISAWIWDLTTGERVHELKDPDGDIVSSASFSPDGTTVVTGTYGGVAHTWDVATGTVQGQPMDNETDWVNAATYSPDGQLIATADSNGTVGVWRASTGARLGRTFYHVDEVWTVVFSADSQSILSAGDRTADVIDVSGLVDDDVSTGDVLSVTVRQLASWVDAAAFSPDDRYVVTANQDGTARVADAATGDQLFTLGGHTGIVWTAQFSPDGNRVVTASEDGTARVWNIDTGIEMRGTSQRVDSVQFSSDGATILTAEWAGDSTMWDAADGTETGRFAGTTLSDKWLPMRSAEFAADGREVLTAQNDGTVAFWDVATRTQTLSCCDNVTASGDYFPPSRAAVVPGQPDHVLVSYFDSTLHVWDLSKDIGAQDVRTIKEGAVIGFAISPDGKTIVTVGRDDKMARVWRADWSSNSFDEVGRWMSGLVSNLDFDRDGTRVVMGGLDGVVRVWDVSTGKQVFHERDDEMRVPGGAVTTAAFNFDGTRILAGGLDGVVRIWDAASASFLADLQVHAGPVNWIDTYSDGRIATASDDHSAKVFECKTCGPIDEVVRLAREQAAIDPMEMAH